MDETAQEMLLFTSFTVPLLYPYQWWQEDTLKQLSLDMIEVKHFKLVSQSTCNALDVLERYIWLYN